MLPEKNKVAIAVFEPADGDNRYMCFLKERKLCHAASEVKANGESTHRRFAMENLAKISGCYCHGEILWSQIEVEQVFTLIHESSNRCDNRAVRIDWQGKQLGYIPAIDNVAISQLIDRVKRLDAVIVELNQSRNPWEWMEVEVRRKI